MLAPAALAALVPDVTERTTALNFLLSAGLLKTLKNADGKLSFRGVVKGELEMCVIASLICEGVNIAAHVTMKDCLSIRRLR